MKTWRSNVSDERVWNLEFLNSEIETIGFESEEFLVQPSSRSLKAFQWKVGVQFQSLKFDLTNLFLTLATPLAMQIENHCIFAHLTEFFSASFSTGYSRLLQKLFSTWMEETEMPVEENQAVFVNVRRLLNLHSKAFAELKTSEWFLIFEHTKLPLETLYLRDSQKGFSGYLPFSWMLFGEHFSLRSPRWTADRENNGHFMHKMQVQLFCRPIYVISVGICSVRFVWR